MKLSGKWRVRSALIDKAQKFSVDKAEWMPLRMWKTVDHQVITSNLCMLCSLTDCKYTKVLTSAPSGRPITLQQHISMEFSSSRQTSTIFHWLDFFRERAETCSQLKPLYPVTKPRKTLQEWNDLSASTTIPETDDLPCNCRTWSKQGDYAARSCNVSTGWLLQNASSRTGLY